MIRALLLLSLIVSSAGGAEAIPQATAPVVSVDAAGLTFERGEIGVTAQPGQDKIETAFAFENRSSATVKILEARAACGCTVPSLAKTTYAPGESGRVEVVFTVGSRQGPQHLVVTVRTDQGEQTLLLKVDVPPRVEITPRLMMFRAGEAGAKSARIVYLVDTPVAVGEHRLSDPNFQVELRPVVAGKEYEFFVTYTGPAQDARTAFIDLPSIGASGRPAEDRLFVRHAP